MGIPHGTGLPLGREVQGVIPETVLNLAVSQSPYPASSCAVRQKFRQRIIRKNRCVKMALIQDEVTTILRSVVDYRIATSFVAAKSGKFHAHGGKRNEFVPGGEIMKRNNYGTTQVTDVQCTHSL